MKSYIELQVPIRNDARWFDELRTKMSKQGVNVRWQNNHYHITMAFINEIIKKPGISYLAPVYKSLNYKVAPHLTFDTLEAFTSCSKDHIISLTSSCPSKEFCDLVTNVRGNIDEAGWKYEPECRLHVTLGRVSISQISLEDLQSIIRNVSMPSFTLQLDNARFMEYQTHNVIDKYELYPDEVSAEKAAEERKRRAFMNALSNIQLFTDPEA